MSIVEPGTEKWLQQVDEPVVDPWRPIIDPHHHIWKKRFGRNYLLEDLWADTGSGHNVEKTVFVECHAFHRRYGPRHERPLGETEYLVETARRSREHPGRARIAGIVAYADLTLDTAVLESLLQQHEEISEGLFRGIRFAAARDPNPQDLLIVYPAPPELYRRKDFRRGLQLLGRMGLSYDAWHYHHQNLDFLALARAVPGTTLVLNHLGTPLGVGPYRNRREEIFRQWQRDMREIAACPNVVVKLGGLAMPDNGFGWDTRDRPPDSDEVVEVQHPYYEHALECFGPQRCMFESNFPVDRLSLSYRVIWNAFKKMTANYSETEKHALFYGTAERIYRL